MNNSKHYANIALKAAQRAAEKVIKEAHLYQTPLPAWKDNKIEYVIPDMPQKKPDSSTTNN